MTPSRAPAPNRIDRPASRPDLRLRDMMSKPMLAAFLVLAIGTLGLVVYLMIRPPAREAQPLGQRRSAPGGTYTHDVRGISRAPAPTPAASVSVCTAVAGIRLEGRASAVGRLSKSVGALCALTGESIGSELQTALEGLRTARLRFAAFARTGVEATSNLATGELFVNVRFARAETPTVHLAPILAHEGYHLAGKRAGITARSELAARRAELEACRRLIDRDKWQRNCDDALALIRMGEERATALLVAAGYPA